MQGRQRTEDDSHEEVELLLESYLKQVEETANVVASLKTSMTATEDIVNIILDSQRNSLLLLELNIAMGTLGFTGGAFVASLFGMNLPTALEAVPWSFVGVSGFAGLLGLLLFVSTKRHMSHVVRRM